MARGPLITADRSPKTPPATDPGTHRLCQLQTLSLAAQRAQELGLGAPAQGVAVDLLLERASLGGVAISDYSGPLAREAASDYRRVVDEVLRDW